MKKLFTVLFCIFPLVSVGSELSCGDGYILGTHAKVDGITALECQKLWCRDLEKNKVMGDENTAASGYKTTSNPSKLCDAENNCAYCFGDRKWCAGESTGIWNPDYGAYTRGGADDSMYVSYQKGGCFAWKLGRLECSGGMSAILQDGKWVCVTSSGAAAGSRESAVRRTSGFRRLSR